MTSRLGTGKWQTFFYSVAATKREERLREMKGDGRYRCIDRRGGSSAMCYVRTVAVVIHHAGARYFHVHELEI